MKQFFKDLKEATLKQWLLMSFPYTIVFAPLFLITEIFNQYINANCISQCNNCGEIDCSVGDWTSVLRWVFLGIALYPFIRNFIYVYFILPFKKK